MAREEKKRMLALKKQEREQKKAEKEIQKMEKQLEKEKKEIQKMEKQLEKEKKQAERENKKAEQLKKKMEREQKKLEREQKKIEKEQKKKDQPSKIKKKFSNENVQLSSMDDDDKSSTSVRTTAEVEPVGGETTPPDHSKTDTSKVTETGSERIEGSEATGSNESNASSSNSPGMAGPQLHVELFKEGDTDTHTSVPESTGEETDDPIKPVTTKEEAKEVTRTRSTDEDMKQENTCEDEKTAKDTSTEHEENQKGQISLLTTNTNTNDLIQLKFTKEQKHSQSKCHFKPPLQSKTNAPKSSLAKNQATRKRFHACEDKQDKKPKQKSARQRSEQSDQCKSRMTPANTVGPVWVQCDHPDCLKWRMLRDVTDPSLVPDKWYCSMNTGEAVNCIDTCTPCQLLYIASCYIVWHKHS